jgi:hypothetical protein
MVILLFDRYCLKSTQGLVRPSLPSVHQQNHGFVGQEEQGDCAIESGALNAESVAG